MARLRTLHPKRDFTQVSNLAMDLLPDLHSLGALNHMLRPDDHWDFRLEDLARKKPGVTRRDVSKARATLLRYGFYVSVRFRHSYRGRYATEIYRSVVPHTDEDLAAIARLYQPGNVTQIPKLDEDKKPLRDAHGRPLLREVTITWAEVESWRGKERVSAAGTLPEPAAAEDAEEGAAEPDETPSPGEADRGVGSGTPARPAQTEVFPGGTEVPLSGGSESRVLGERWVYKKTGEKTAGEDQTEGAAAPTPPSSELGCHTENAGHSDMGVTEQGELVSNPPDARAGTEVHASSTGHEENESSQDTEGDDGRSQAQRAAMAAVRRIGKQRTSRDCDSWSEVLGDSTIHVEHEPFPISTGEPPF